MNQQRKTYVLFDRTTGRILGTHAVYDAEVRDYRVPTPQEAQAAFHRLLEGRTSDQVDMMEAEFPTLSSPGRYYVDVAQRQLVSKPQIRVQSERTQLQGDGKDSVELKISLVNEAGEVVESFDGDLRVMTSRGRLSSPGGRIKVDQGRASITLTSVAETVAQVSITVQDPSGRCTDGHLDLEFL